MISDYCGISIIGRALVYLGRKTQENYKYTQVTSQLSNLTFLKSGIHNQGSKTLYEKRMNSRWIKKQVQDEIINIYCNQWNGKSN